MKLILCLVLVLLLAPGGASALILDTFNTNQDFSAAPGFTVYNIVDDSADPYIMGSERDVSATANGGASSLLVASDAGGSGTFSVNAPSSQLWSVTIQWDGLDNSFSLDPTGLGGVDLTSGGVDDHFGMWILESDHPDLSVTMEVYTSAAQWSSYSTTAANSIFSPGQEFLIPYNSFVNAGGSGGADFTNVGAILLTMTSSNEAHDVQLDFFQTTTAVPEPATMFLLGSGLFGFSILGRKRLKKT